MGPAKKQEGISFSLARFLVKKHMDTFCRALPMADKKLMPKVNKNVGQFDLPYVLSVKSKKYNNTKRIILIIHISPPQRALKLPCVLCYQSNHQSYIYIYIYVRYI